MVQPTVERGQMNIYIQRMTWGYAGECSIIDKKTKCKRVQVF